MGLVELCSTGRFACYMFSIHARNHTRQCVVASYTPKWVYTRLHTFILCMPSYTAVCVSAFVDSCMCICLHTELNVCLPSNTDV